MGVELVPGMEDLAVSIRNSEMLFFVLFKGNMRIR